ncbi:MAG: hypothetical protein PHR96_03960 [Clostridia bacterium]|nr:hypothetical protein [Clostridia bacterium]
MTNIKNLSKIYIKQIFSNYSSIVSKKKKSSSRAGVAFLIIILAYIMFSISMQYIIQMDILKAVNMQDYILLIGLLFTNLIMFLIITYEIQGNFFKHEDFELVTSLPLKPLEIVVSKFLSILFFTYIYQSVILLPAVIIWFIYGSVTVSSVIFLILGYIFIPFFTLLICSTIAFLINYLTSKLRSSNSLNLIMLFIFFFGLMVVMYLVQTELANIFSLGEIPVVLYILMPTSILLFNALAYGSIIWFILFILSCVLCFALTMWLLASFHSKINKRLNNKKVAYKKGKLNFKQKSVMQSLLHIEIKNYFNNNIYVFNTLFGMIMLVIASVAGTILYFSNPAIIAGLTGEIIYIIVLLAYCFMCGLSITSNSSISLEGKALYVKKSLPLKTSQIFISKILLNIVVVLPFLIIGFLCILPALIALQLHLIAILSIFLVPLIMLCSLSTVSLMVNLWFPKLNYTTETEVVKQSLSVMITIFLGMVLVGVFALVYAYLLSMLNIYIYVALCTFVLLLIGITFAFLLKTKGQNIFRELN